MSEPKKKKSWKTTAAGIVGGLAIILTQIGFVLDSDPATVLDMAALASGVGLLGLGWFSRDNDVSSEDVGNK